MQWLTLIRTQQTPVAPSASGLYKTNVNRQKTKRWVEAKSYSYDGDDWGDVDEYRDIEEEEEEEPAPPTPPPKPTGFRQPGQVLNAPGNTGGRSVTNPGK